MMESTLTTLLTRVRRRWIAVAALRAFARAALGAAFVCGLAGVTERWLLLGDGPALLLAAFAAVLVLALVAMFAWPLRRRPDDRRVARFIEERIPACEDAVVTAVDVQQRGTGDNFAPLVVSAAARRLASIDLAPLFDADEMRRGWRRAAVAAMAAAVSLAVVFPLAERAAQVVYLRLFPASVSVRVSPGNMRVPAGRPATIVATVTARHGALTRIAPRITIEAAGQAVTLPMERRRDGYQLQLRSVERSFSYSVSAGPATSSRYSVTALHPARVQRIELQYDYPSFTGLKPRIERDAGDVYGPAGTRVRVVVHADKTIASGALAFSQGKPASALAKLDARTLSASLTLDGEAAYRVALVDADGLPSESVEYFVRVMDDRPPEVHILRPSGDEPITPLQEVPIEARADDDFGVARMEMVYSVGGGAETVVPFTKFSGTEIARIGSRMLAAEDLKVKPGDVIAYYARAWDVPRAKRSTLARSEIFFLEVKPFNEEYSMAQSQAGMQAATATQLDGLISAQKEIISATWNLERRSTAGRSATDIKGVADAQAELKTRAEGAAGAQRQRRRFGQEPQKQIRPPRESQNGSDDPVVKAVEAMGKAVQNLQTQRTSDAIPHEMAALNALLQAQAEIRQKQVMQQNQSGGGGWGNRQTQDLSSLFDRELKRQQKTNYENKADVETQPEGEKGESALDKIKDLARRQEELNRRQRDLSKAGLSQEEMKRQLEKLTREQEELRRQAEQAAREGAKGAGSASANAVGQALNEAMRQMRDAAEHGQKDDASGAASKGEQAADALRRAEAQMQNGSPDAQKRALGDLQLESQQIAQEQRRVANEAERLDREGGGTSDARRRLATEKDRLADRVEAMQQAAQRLPSAADAARDLAAGRLADRMRSGAQALRDNKSAGKTAPPEQQIADALDRVARKIGGSDAGGAKGNTQQLANQLDEVRDARERIARLEREMRDAQRQSARAGQDNKSPGNAGKSGAEGKQGSRGSQGEGQGADVARLQEQLNQELQRTRDLLNRLQRGNPESGGRMTTPEEHEWSRSAPGTEAFKQDYKAWQSLASDVGKALERAESSAASRLSGALAKDRLRAGGSERVPDAYRKQVSKYFESIAVKKGGA